MKFLVLCATVAILNGVLCEWKDVSNNAPRGPSDSVRQTLENLRKRMPCGFPEYGIPPLAPFESSQEYFEINEDFISGFIELFNLHIGKLNEFKIMDISFNILTLKLPFDINFEEITSTGKYDLNLIAPKILELSGNGDLDLTLKDLRFKGYLKLSANLKGVTLKECNVVVSLGDVRSKLTGLAGGGTPNEFLNKLIERLLLDTIKDHEKYISKKIFDIVVPMANKELKKYSLSDVIGMITKPGKPVECIPPPKKISLLEQIFIKY